MTMHVRERRWYDRVHGEVCLVGVPAEVSDTVEFNRLDGIRQLGACSFVYPSATHTRREHSIGVCYLAGMLGRHLQDLYPDLVDDADLVCLQVAGLLHDVGHGPFSHLFETHVRDVIDSRWSHETMSCTISRGILTRLEMANVDIDFVELLIRGLPSTAQWPESRVGRPECKRFLVDIVHNCTNGVDVDKLDYLLRDSLAVFGATHSINASRLLRATRVHRNTLSFVRRAEMSIQHVFDLRTRLHRQVYQHRDVLVAEDRLRDILRSCGTEWIASRLNDVSLYITLTDASVMATMTRAQSQRLYTRPQMHWIARVELSTDPACNTCMAPTRIRDRHCTQCGASTVDRPWVIRPQTTHRVPRVCTLDVEALTRRLRQRCVHDDVYVLLCNVYNGVPIVVEDVHGHKWRDFATLSVVRFTDDSPGEEFMSTPKHMMVVHCYTSTQIDRATAARLYEVLLEELASYSVPRMACQYSPST